MTRNIAILLLAAAPFAAGPAAAAQSQTYHIKFAPMVGSQPFRCGATYANFGRGRASITPEFFRFYVSQVRLLDAAGHKTPLHLEQDGVWQRADVAFLSFEDAGSGCASGSPQKHEEIVGTAPASHFTGIEFTIGVPEELDHADATIAASPLNLSDMFWSWQDGYKFFRFDTRVRDASGASAAYIFHLGSTGCTMSNNVAHCANLNRPTIGLTRFDPAKNVIVADLAAMYKNADVYALARGGGCMSNADDACQPAMQDLGIAWGGKSAGPQQLFSVR